MEAEDIRAARNLPCSTRCTPLIPSGLQVGGVLR